MFSSLTAGAAVYFVFLSSDIDWLHFMLVKDVVVVALFQQLGFALPELDLEVEMKEIISAV